jgi:hypothetical protein
VTSRNVRPAVVMGGVKRPHASCGRSVLLLLPRCVRDRSVLMWMLLLLPKWVGRLRIRAEELALQEFVLRAAVCMY